MLNIIKEFLMKNLDLNLSGYDIKFTFPEISISTAEADDFIFGMVIFNDWSARDIQKWEYWYFMVLKSSL